ncbi:MAG: hypothetical protein EOO07_05270 [Chitinophagaceae bacterium]|nr:MAG: hypothetical protein EOO07_05270 [Chitinophagaceae bacterium]
MSAILFSWTSSAGLTDPAENSPCDHNKEGCASVPLMVNMDITHADSCATPYQTFPIVYFGDEIISYKGRNYKVIIGPIWGLHPTMPGQAHLYKDLGMCK